MFCDVAKQLNILFDKRISDIEQCLIVWSGLFRSPSVSMQFSYRMAKCPLCYSCLSCLSGNDEDEQLAAEEEEKEALTLQQRMMSHLSQEDFDHFDIEVWFILIFDHRADERQRGSFRRFYRRDVRGSI